MLDPMIPTDPGQIAAALRSMAEQSDDPTKKLLAQMALQKMEQAQEQAQEPAPRPAPSRQKSEVDNMRHDIRRLIAMNREAIQAYQTLKTEHEHLIELNDMVSRAVGACTCWGTHPNCNRCEGKGIPGAFELDESAFSTLFLPLVQAILQQSQQQQALEN